MKRLVCSFYSIAAILMSALTGMSQEPAVVKTFCNPLSIPNYPIGKLARDIKNGDAPDSWQWRLGRKEQFRELADVTALWEDNKWYIYPSVEMAWVSEDFGATWQHHPLNVPDLGYAPTIVKHQNKFLLMASDSSIYTSDSPLGPFQELGKIGFHRKAGIPGFIDPMLFSDNDGRLFYYWGCTPSSGIWGMELNADNPTKVISAPAELIPFRPSEFPWEAVGEWNQDPNRGWMEGAWMLKRNGKYYLTYCAGGTENRTYAMGCYVSDSPLGPFKPQKRNPILRTIDGLVTGAAHGCVVAGANDELWAFYTVRAGVVHAFERRLGMDRAAIDENGELIVYGATSLPQWLPGSVNSNTPHTGWLPLNDDMQTIGSSNATNLEGRFAVDDEMRTWWQPDSEDDHPTLTTSFLSPATINATRVIWRDVGMDSNNGIKPGPIGYRIEVETKKDQWTTIIDRTSSIEDLLVDYRECPPTTGARARLVITQWPQGITPAVAEFTLFGNTIVTSR
jgi:hypothetical protein